MANNYKTVGQAAPSANTDTNLYVVPANNRFVSSTLSICNRNVSGVNSKFRVAVVPNGESLSNKHYVIYEQFINSRDTIYKSIGMTLAEGDTVIVRSDSADLSFSLFGNEIT